MPWLIKELKQFSQFFSSKIPLFSDENHAINLLKMFIEKHLVIVAEGENGIEGFISGTYSRHYFNPDIKVLTELFWWVPKELRTKSRAGLMLLDEFTKIGNATCDWVVFTLETHSPVNERCLFKRGYQAKEHTYILEVGR